MKKQTSLHERTSPSVARDAGTLLHPPTAIAVLRERIRSAVLLGDGIELDAATTKLLGEEYERAIRVAASALTQR